MIVPMKKVSVVVLDRERRQALTQLKKAGVMHLETLEGSGEQLSAFREASANARAAVAVLADFKADKKRAAAKELSRAEIQEKCARIISLSEQKKRLLDEISADAAEIERFASWGGVNPDDFSYLAGKGVRLRMYEIPEDKYGRIDGSVRTLCVNWHKKIINFLLVGGSDGDDAPALPPEAYAVPLPRCSTEALAAEIEKDRRTVSEIDAELSESAAYVPAIQAFGRYLESDIEFENICSGMGKDGAGRPDDLAWLSGFVPADSFDRFRETAAANSWAFAASDPADDDMVPTKLKNNRLVSLIYPLTDFLGTVPGYHEYDISGWFLLFFTVFFGMIFGDGGYGLLVTAAALILLLKAAARKKPAQPMLGLVLLLGLSTVAWGTVTCTWFGLSMETIPAWLKNLSVPPLSNAYSDVRWQPFWTQDGSGGSLTTAQNLQIFCFALAFLQLSVAHLKGMARYRRSLKCLGEFGSLLMLWGMFYVVLSMVVSSEVFGFGEVICGVPIGTVSVGLIAAGFALSFVFSNYEGSVAQSVLESVKGIISVLLGVVNVFSDIVSYIRLWAVGLAGAAISNTVNSMAGPLLGHAILFAAAVLLLVFGHGLNMILNLLSVIVHGVRLNTLEFSTHLGMSWSGFKYQPFSETVRK